MRWLCKVPREKRVAGLRSTGTSIEDGLFCARNDFPSWSVVHSRATVRTSGAGSKYVGSGRGNVAEAGRLIGDGCRVEMLDGDEVVRGEWRAWLHVPTVDLSMAWALELRNRQDCM